MTELHSYLQKHAVKYVRGTTNGEGTDVFFFEVQASKSASASELKELIHAFAQNDPSVNLFDGKEHGYIEVGGWLGSQSDALALIGLGAELGMWKLLTPKTVIGPDVPEDIEEQMAGAGYITLLAKAA